MSLNGRDCIATNKMHHHAHPLIFLLYHVNFFIIHRRRQSLRTIPGLSLMKLRAPRNTSNATKQTLHIFISNLKCTFYKKRKYKVKEVESPGPQLQSADTGKPDPFMAFLSYPKRLVKEERSAWEKFEGIFRGPADLRTETNDDGSISRTAGGWPRTKKLIATMDPDWSNEGEIHLKVKSHDKHGIPFDHTGAILYFSAFNAASLDLNLIGTFAMNLGMLCSTARTARRSELTARSSVYLKNDAMSAMTSLEINQPLLKNGRETGWINCDLDVCWLDDAANPQSLKSMKQDAKQKRLRREKSS